MYIYIEGGAKEEVANAYKEVKKQMEEAGMDNMHQSVAAAIGGF